MRMTWPELALISALTGVFLGGVIVLAKLRPLETAPQTVAVLQQQHPDPGGTATVVWQLLGTRTAELAKCRQHHEAALISAFAWYTTTLAMQTACPDSGVPTPNIPSP